MIANITFYLMKQLLSKTIVPNFFRSPKPAINTRTYYNNIPAHSDYGSPSTRTRPTNSQTSSYYSSSPSTHDAFKFKVDTESTRHYSSTTNYSSSYQSDSLYNEPGRKHSPRVLTTTSNNRTKAIYHSPCNRKNLPTPPTERDNDSEPHQALLPIGGGVVGKLASSTTTLSYRKLSSSDLVLSREKILLFTKNFEL